MDFENCYIPKGALLVGFLLDTSGLLDTLEFLEHLSLIGVVDHLF